MCRYTHVLVCLALAFASASARADVYGFVDEQGVAHFSNVPLDPRYTLFMKVAERRPAPVSDAAAGASPMPQATAEIATGKPYDAIIASVAKEQGVEAALLHAVITVESAYNPRAKSSKGRAG